MNKQGRVGLGVWDRLVLLVAWIVTCGLVYLLGFYVGKGADGRAVALPDRSLNLPVTSTPPPAGQRPKSESELTFYDRLAAGERGESAAPPRSPAPTPPAAPAAPAAPRAPAPPEPEASTPKATPAPPAASPAPAPARPPSTTSAPSSAVSPPARTASNPTPPTPSPPAAGRGWTVLASPTRNRSEAEDLQRQLRGKGYDASLVRVARDGDTWYRVQIGRFGSAAQANEVMHRLREREGVSHVFVASE
jgi:cell division protein FtsN